MPNTKPPILTADDLKRYRAAITTAVPNWRPLMSFQIHSHADIPALKAAGAVAGKYYPAGLTNADSSSCQTLADFDSVLAQMEEFGIVLSVHCEAPLYLKIVLEHISLEREVEAVRLAGENVAATLTAHHLTFTAADFIGAKLNPHLFCKPILQNEKHRGALRAAAVSGNPRFFFGSDSAPHLPEFKTGTAVSPGIYSMPVTLPLLACLFEEADSLTALEPFVSVFGRRFYGIPETSEKITVIKKKLKVPFGTDGVVPLCAGAELPWSVKESEEK